MQPDLSSAIKAARGLLGWKLVHETPEGRTAGYIVETEAYSMEDPASHAYGGETSRNGAMFRRAGTIYVYFTYGMHYCVNIVTGEEGHGQGVLIRAIEPCEGLELMKRRRNLHDNRNLANGPAKLVQAMGVRLEQRGSHISDGPLFLEPGIRPSAITRTTRVGISKGRNLKRRFYITDNPYVSKT